MHFLPSSSLSNILLATFLLISHLPIYGRAERDSHIIDNTGFKSNCAFHLNNYSFNLCPLTGTATATSRTRLYEVALGGMSTESSRCDSDTWVCMTDGASIETQGNEDRHHFLSKKQGMPIAGRSGTKIVIIKDESLALQLLLDGGEAEGRPQSAEITMMCDLNVESYLEFINERHGIHSFRWTTLHGCPTNIRQSYIQSSRLSTTDEADDSESESEKEKSDDELLPQTGTARRWMAVILVIVMMTVLCSSLLLAYPRARHVTIETIWSLSYSLMPILSAAGTKLRPIGKFVLALTPRSLLCGVGNLNPFRQGSDQLVKWAEEDMTLREADGYDEESWSGIQFDEYIPLTANPKHGRNKDAKSYGAMPDVETLFRK